MKSGTPQGNYLTSSELAARLGRDARTIRKWRAEGMPAAKLGRGGSPSEFDEAAVRAWLKTREHTRQQDSAELVKARTRRELAMARESEQRADLRAGRLVPAEDVERTWSREVASVRAYLLLWSTTLAAKVCRVAVTDGEAAVEALLELEVRRVLTEFSTREHAPKARRTPRTRGARKAKRS